MAEDKLVKYSIVFVGLVLLVMVLKTLQTFIRPFIIAVLLTFLLMPLIRFSKKTRIPFIISFLAVLSVIIVSLGFIGYLLTIEAEELGNSNIKTNINDRYNELNGLLNSIPLLKELDMENIIDINRITQIVAVAVGSFVQTIGGFFTELLMVIIFTIFLIPSHEKFINSFEKAMKPAKARKFKTVLEDIEKSIYNYLSTKIVISFGTAVVSGFILYLFDSDFVVLFSLMIFLFNFIPNIGSIMAVVVALFGYLIKTGLTLEIMWLAILLTMVQMLFGNYLEPKIAGTRLNLSPIIIILSMLLWYWIWGVMGMILSIPLTAIIKIILSHVNSTKRIAYFMS